MGMESKQKNVRVISWKNMTKPGTGNLHEPRAVRKPTFLVWTQK